MILADAGPLVALLDADEVDHERCRAALRELTLPMVTTWPAFTEAMSLVARAGGWPAQEALWRLALREDLVVAELPRRAIERAAALMEQYEDLPMDLADATLVALAEERGLRRVFTLDAHFRVYRFRGRQPLRSCLQGRGVDELRTADRLPYGRRPRRSEQELDESGRGMLMACSTSCSRRRRRSGACQSATMPAWRS